MGDDVTHLGMHRDGGVRDEGPRGGRPHQQLGATGQWARGHREADEDRRVAVVLVALGQLVVGQGRATPRAVRCDAVVLAEQTLVPDPLEAPPHRLDVGRVHRPVRLVHVDPVAHSLGELAEGVDVAGDGFTALGVEGLDAVLLDVGLAGEPQLLLDGQLDRQAVAIPAGLAVDAESLHGLEAGEDVLEDASLDVVGTRLTVGGRWTLEEGPRLAVLGGLQGLLESVFPGPQIHDLVVHRGKVNLRRHAVVLPAVVRAD